MKKAFLIDFADGAPSALAALEWFAAKPQARTFHIQNGFREPLGIYNVSTLRIFDKLVSLAEKIEQYFKLSTSVKELRAARNHRVELIDYIELALYAAAEHVDDIESIATGFFPSNGQARRAKHFRDLQDEIRSYKRFVAVAANAIKHQQSRIRLYSCEFRHGSQTGCLHGFFVEGINNGTLGPYGPLHKSQPVYSITTILWEICWFVLSCSLALKVFLTCVTQQQEPRENLCGGSRLHEAILAAARLPIYTFGEQHPFERATFRLVNCESSFPKVDSAIYGSLKAGWDREAVLSIVADAVEFEGDGSSRSFSIVKPKKVVLQHWS